MPEQPRMKWLEIREYKFLHESFKKSYKIAAEKFRVYYEILNSEI
jgi:regulator of RNase E activity RraB